MPGYGENVLRKVKSKYSFLSLRRKSQIDAAKLPTGSWGAPVSKEVADEIQGQWAETYKRKRVDDKDQDQNKKGNWGLLMTKEAFDRMYVKVRDLEDYFGRGEEWVRTEILGHARLERLEVALEELQQKYTWCKVSKGKDWGGIEEKGDDCGPWADLVAKIFDYGTLQVKSKTEDAFYKERKINRSVQYAIDGNKSQEPFYKDYLALLDQASRSPALADMFIHPLEKTPIKKTRTRILILHFCLTAMSHDKYWETLPACKFSMKALFEAEHLRSKNSAYGTPPSTSSPPSTATPPSTPALSSAMSYRRRVYNPDALRVPDARLCVTIKWERNRPVDQDRTTFSINLLEEKITTLGALYQRIDYLFGLENPEKRRNLTCCGRIYLRLSDKTWYYQKDATELEEEFVEDARHFNMIIGQAARSEYQLSLYIDPIACDDDIYMGLPSPVSDVYLNAHGPVSEMLLSVPSPISMHFRQPGRPSTSDDRR